MASTYELIASQTLGSSAASITLGGSGTIPQTYTDLVLLISARSDRASNLIDGSIMRFNGAATDANLSYRHLQGNGASAISATGSIAPAGILPAATATANTFSSSVVYIPNYAGSANKSYSASTVMETNGTTAYITEYAGLWSDTSAIDEIQVLAQNANFVSGSSFYLYGITKA